MSESRTRLILMASDMGLLKKVPKGTFDKHGENVPAKVWQSQSFARRWLLAGGELPAKATRSRRSPAIQKERGLSKRKLDQLDRQARMAALDWVGDQLSDGRDPDELLNEGVASDLAEGVLFGEGIERPFPEGLKGRLADEAHDAICQALKEED